MLRDKNLLKANVYTGALIAPFVDHKDLKTHVKKYLKCYNKNCFTGFKYKKGKIEGKEAFKLEIFIVDNMIGIGVNDTKMTSAHGHGGFKTATCSEIRDETFEVPKAILNETEFMAFEYHKEDFLPVTPLKKNNG